MISTDKSECVGKFRFTSLGNFQNFYTTKFLCISILWRNQDKTCRSQNFVSGDGAGVSGSDKAEKMFLVKYKYASSQPDELSLKVGDIIIHVSDCEPGWATGKVRNELVLSETAVLAIANL